MYLNEPRRKWRRQAGREGQGGVTEWQVQQ